MQKIKVYLSALVVGEGLALSERECTTKETCVPGEERIANRELKSEFLKDRHIFQRYNLMKEYGYVIFRQS